MRKGMMVAAMVAASSIMLLGDHAAAGRRFAMSGHDGYGAYRNLIVREVKVEPIRAHVGDVVTIEMVVEDVGDLYPGSTRAEIYANRKVVASSLLEYGYGGEGGRIKRATFTWDTRWAAPGEYLIRGEVFLWGDASEFDNFLNLGEPLILAAPGEGFPAGANAGGFAVSRDPRYKPPASTAGY